MTARARQRAGIYGLSTTRKLLRRVPKAVTEEVREAIEDSAQEAVEVERFFAPRKDGDLVQSITYVLSTDGLSAVIGPGIRGATVIKKRAGSYFATRRTNLKGRVLNFAAQTRFDRFQLMKAYWLEVGTKKMGRHPFVEPTWDAIRKRVTGRIAAAVDKALGKIAKGGA